MSILELRPNCWQRRTIAGQLTLALAFSWLLAEPGLAQRGDRQGAQMTEVWRQMEVPEAAVLSPQQALDSLRVAPGFRVGLVAAEPLVEDPITIDWDELGRMWVVEMRGFMPNVDGQGEQEPVGRVVVLEDLDHDGVMDKSTVFLDRLVLARALTIVDGGVLIGEPPNLWYCRDTDGDLVCDEKTRVGDYGDPHPDALEHTENGLLQALDNWIYNAKSDRRFRFRGGRLIEEETQFRGQWGITQDDDGRLFYNTNSRYLLGDLFPSAYLARNPNYRLPSGGKGIAERLVADESVYTIRVNPGINRGYEKRMLRPDGRLAVTTSVSGLAIYRGHQYPESYRGDVFIPEPAGNVVTYHRLIDRGIEIGTEHVTYDDPDWGQREFLASTDERFRPVDCAVGPDGTLYVVDMYRGILQHQKFVTTFLRQQILERGLDKPLGLGRIYRIVAEDRPHQAQPPALTDSADQMAALSHPSGWVRDTAQRLLVDSEDSAIGKALHSLVSDAKASELARIHALWSLEGRDEVDAAVLESALSSKSYRLVRAALRVADSLDEEPVRRLVARHAERGLESSDSQLRLQSAFSLGNLTADARQGAAARKRLVSLLVEHPEDVYLRQAVLSSLHRYETEALLALAKADSGAVHDVAVRDLAKAVFLGTPKASAGSAQAASELPESGLDLLLRNLTDFEPELRGRVVEALAEAAASTSDGPRATAGQPSRLAEVSPRLSSKLAEIDRSVVWPGKATPSEASKSTAKEPESRSADIQDPDLLATMVQRGKRLYSACSSCHGEQGQGDAGMGPRLAKAGWIEGSPEVLIRIVLDGVEGPLEIDGEKWDDLMPGFRQDRRFTDDGVAALLTFLRKSWGADRSAVSPATVEAVRQEIGERTKAWTVEELTALAPD